NHYSEYFLLFTLYSLLTTHYLLLINELEDTPHKRDEARYPQHFAKIVYKSLYLFSHGDN
ncbi:MAG: hypothetical protein AAFQ91_33340, partial [Cyanobacteria bacterium J06621_15]